MTVLMDEITSSATAPALAYALCSFATNAVENYNYIHKQNITNSEIQ